MDLHYLEQPRHNATDSRGLNVRKARCDRCLFGPIPLIPWNPSGRQKIDTALRDGTHFTCHEFNNVMCRGFYDSYGTRLWYVRLAQHLNVINLVENPQ